MSVYNPLQITNPPPLNTPQPPSSPYQRPAPYIPLHNCFGPLALFVEDLLLTGHTTSSFYLLVEMVLSINLFQAYMW